MGMKKGSGYRANLGVLAKTAERGYGARWQKASKAFLRAHPLCRSCEAIGVIELATVTDHIIAHKGDMVLFWDSKNWQPLCATCHNRKTAREDGGMGNNGSSKPAADCGIDGVPVDPRHHWNR